MKLLLGHMGHAPRDAWRMTLIEYDAAWRGYAEKHGLTKPTGVSRAELDALMARYPDKV